MTPYWHTPAHKGEEVQFRLRPLKSSEFYEIQTSMLGRRAPSWDGISAAADCIVGWKGLPAEFSQKAVQDVLAGTVDVDWIIWLTEITGHLYSQALLPESERKN